ncbi:sodium:solute symporter family protein [Natronorubrum tibetense]|uniref:Sodium/panthothenate symporter n=1 Tax=Natronorubrum tibetense GA33 TaxID=1114856 RepID=L9VNU8_9EURY|nr:sodium:solute symporter family protein [Natronorubrum tibetense]ELY38890.1 sodium/panthothenate symporter [Natronorubrum tibetense GA33]
MVRVGETAIVLCYFILVLAIGLYFRNRRSADEYWSANGSIGTFVNSMAIFAAFASGGTFLGAIGIVYDLGVPLWWSAAVGSVAGFLIAAIFVAKPLRRLEMHTLPDIFDYLYTDSRINVLAPVIILVGYFMYMVAQLRAGGLVSDYLLGVGYIPAVTAIGIVFIAYVALGGMWAITVTDFLQGVLMWGLLAVIWAISFGYFGYSMSAPISETPRVTGTGALEIQTYIGFALIWAFAIAVLPHIAMRAFSAKSPESAKRAYAWVALMYIIVTLPFVHIAGAAIAIDPELAEADYALLLVMESILPELVAGFAAATILAAVMSSTDALLLAMAAALSNDLYGNAVSDVSEERIVNLGTVSVVVIGLLGIVAAWSPPAYLVELYTDGTGLMAAAFFFPLLLGIWWKPMNHYGAMAGMLGGSLAYAIAYFYTPMFGAIIYAVPVSLLCCLVATWVTDSRSAEQIEKLSEELGHGRLGW